MKKTFKTLLLSFVVFLSLISTVKGASGYINVSSSSSTVIVGKTFTTTVTISSSVPLGSWEYTLNYNSSLLKLEKGTLFIADYGNGTKKSASYTYTFKALASGTANINVKSFAAYDWDEKVMSLTSGSSSVKLMTQAQLEATYSKNNYLKNLSIEGKEITPAFNKEVTEYTVELEPNIENINIIATVEDNKSTVSGNGVNAVTEGDNKIEIIVTAQNGGTRKYVINAIIKDPNPIEVTTINGDKKTIVKRESLLKLPEDFIINTTNINDVIVPSLYNQKNQLVLVGLKDSEGNISLYIYDSIEKKYSPYLELIFDKLRILPLELKTDKDKFKNYLNTTIALNDTEIQVYKINKKSEYSIIYGLNIEKAEKNYYIYDEVEKSIIRFDNAETLLLNKKIEKNSTLINILIITNIITLSLLVTSISTYIIKRKKKPLEKEIKKKIKENKKIEKEKQED